MVAGAMAGLAGAFLSVGQVGVFVEGMSAGRGFLVLAAVIFGRWRPLGVLTACAMFGAVDALQLQLQGQASVPRQVWLAVVVGAAMYLVVGILVRGNQRSVTSFVAGLTVIVVAATLLVVGPRLSLPAQLWLSMPYVLPLLALAGFVGRARMPAALAVVYRRGAKP